MISEAIMIALISAAVPAVGSIIVQLIVTHSNNKKRKREDAEKEKQRAVEEAKKDAELKAWMKEIERTLKENNHKLDIHNGYAEKIGSLQTDVAYIRGKLDAQEVS